MIDPAAGSFTVMHAAHELGRNFIGVDLLSGEGDPMRIAGIDPGPIGGRAAVEIVNGIAPQLVAAIDIPSVGLAAKRPSSCPCPARALQRSRSLRRSRIDLFVPDGTTECAP